MAWREQEPDPIEIFYWRTTTGIEVDFVLEIGQLLLPIEVKASARLRHGDTRGLQTFLDEYPESAPAAVLLYTGSEVTWMRERIIAIPWWMVM